MKEEDGSKAYSKPWQCNALSSPPIFGNWQSKAEYVNHFTNPEQKTPVTLLALTFPP